MMARVLILGYGNPGRLDDGLGPALAGWFANAGLPWLTVESDYQLQVEHALLVAEHDRVYFADASVAGPEPFGLQALDPASAAVACGYTSHSCDAAGVLALAHQLFNARTSGVLLSIRGYEFDGFGERLSPRAQRNLEAAAGHLADLLGRGAHPVCDHGGLTQAPGGGRT